MKRAVVLVCMTLVLPLLVHGQSVIEIYAAFQEDLYGVAIDRGRIREYRLEDFSMTDTLDFPGGILTAVTVSAQVRNDLISLLDEKDEYTRDDVHLFRYNLKGVPVFRLRYIPVDLEFSFSLEKPDSRFYEIIDFIYAARPDAAAEVRTHYADNYVVRIHSAENIVDPEKKTLEFEEALLAATVVGESFQTLLGVRDGHDLLGNSGYAVAEKDFRKPLGVQYRPVSENESGLNLFLMKLLSMDGDPSDNLYIQAAASFRLEKTDGWMELPENFIRTMRGDTFDMAFFLYDILRRLGMEAVLLCVAPADGSTEMTGAVVFRKDRTWRFIDYLGLYEASSPDWTRLPALVNEVTMLYREIDITEAVETGLLPDPENGDWKKSVY